MLSKVRECEDLFNLLNTAAQWGINNVYIQRDAALQDIDLPEKILSDVKGAKEYCSALNLSQTHGSNNRVIYEAMPGFRMYVGKYAISFFALDKERNKWVEYQTKYKQHDKWHMGSYRFQFSDISKIDGQPFAKIVHDLILKANTFQKMHTDLNNKVKAFEWEVRENKMDALFAAFV